MKNSLIGTLTAASAVALIAGYGTANASSSHPASSLAQAEGSSSFGSQANDPVGTTFKINDGLNNAVYSVQAVKVLDPAAPDNSFDAAPGGKHLVAVEFVIKGISGHEQDSSDNNSAVQGSNGQIYTANVGGVAAGTDFNSGQYSTSPGSSETGWVNFVVPDGVTVTNVQWTPDSGMGSSTATWTN